MNDIFQKLKSSFRKYPLFLLLLPLFFIYSGYNELFGFLSAGFVLKNFFYVLLFVACVYLISWVLLRNKSKAAVFTFFFALFSLVFGYLQDLLKSSPLPAAINKYSILLPVILILFIGLFIYLKKTKNKFGDLFNFLNLLFVILILSEIPNSIKRYRLDKSVHNLIDFRFNAFNDYKPSSPVPDSAKPDIYFLVFDAMSSSKGLRIGLNKDNCQLDTFLQQKGFYVASNAKANYNWTIHSLSTTLNMDYLPPWIAPVMNDAKVYFWGSSSFLNNSAFSILKKEGYDTHSYQQISFGNKQWPGKTYFEDLKSYHFLFKTLPGRIVKDLFWNYLRIDANFIRKHQLNSIASLIQKKKEYFDTTVSLVKQSCTASNKPKFVYGHFMVPHDPYVFERNGNLKTADQFLSGRGTPPAADYYEQLLFTTKTIEDLVTYIQTHNKTNTVIIVEGDHGYKTEGGVYANYAFQNLNSFYFPDQNYQQLYDSITPVNSFRVVFNKYFNGNLPLLKDTSIYVSGNKETIRKSEKIQPVHTPSNPNQ